MLSRPDKDALRALLSSQVEEMLQSNPDAVTIYASKPEPERKPYQSKPTVQDQAFNRELDQMRANAEAGAPQKSDDTPEAVPGSSLALDDYPGLNPAGISTNPW